MQTHEKSWKAWRKFSFRFFFLFFGLTSTFCWVITGYYAYAAVFKASIEDLYKLYKPFSGFFYWLDKHIYHTGYDPQSNVSLSIYDNDIVIFNMRDKQDWYHYDTDSLKKNFTLHSLYKSPTETLQYNYPAGGKLQLSGKWKGKDISVSLKLSPVDSMYLNKEKIKILQD